MIIILNGMEMLLFITGLILYYVDQHLQFLLYMSAQNGIYM